MIWEHYDVVVVGGGHAGAEAAASSATMGAKTLLITQMVETICQMSCNPAIGGVAKGQIVREIDALGGWTGIVTDWSAIQFRMLNRSKGPAMWSPRAQCDKMKFSLNWRHVLENIPNLSIWQDEVVSVIVEHGCVRGGSHSRDSRSSRLFRQAFPLSYTACSRRSTQVCQPNLCANIYPTGVWCGRRWG